MAEGICTYCGAILQPVEEGSILYSCENPDCPGGQPVVNRINLDNSKGSWYSIDFSKVQSLDDIVFILSCIGVSVHDGSPKYEQLKPYLKDQE